MRIKSYFALVTVALLGLTSCDRPTPPVAEPAPTPIESAATGFSHGMTTDLSGYYLPPTEVRIGKWSFDHIFMGQSADFVAWEAGTRSATFAPVMLQFDEVTSPMVRNEIGEVHSITARVLPTAYAVTDTAIAFEGRSAELGLVRFEGRLDPGALATSRRNLGDEGVVVTGSLRVGDAPPQTVSLRWWMGD